MIATVECLDTLAPAEIDERLSALYQREMKAQTRRDQADEMLTGVDFRGQPRLRSPRDIEHYEAALQKAEDEIAQARAEQIPFDNEFHRRGGWNRCFLVTNANGHVHSTMACSTCYVTTQFGWLTEWSGKSYEEIISDAAERACTVCYPDAPVEKKSVMYSPEERADQARREAEHQAREAKKAEKAKKAITASDGSPLRGRWGVIATERTAQIEAVDALLDAKAWTEFHPKQTWHNQSPEEWAARCAENAAEYAARVVPLIEALAAKRGQSVEQVRAELQKKADAKYRKDYR